MRPTGRSESRVDHEGRAQAGGLMVRPSSDSNSDRPPPPGGDGARDSRGGSGLTATPTPMFEVRGRRAAAAAARVLLSIGNLCKDVFLWTQMDVGGFADLAALSRFGLIAALAADAAAELADAACGSCVKQLRRARDDRRDRRAPRVAARARRTPQQRGGSWVLGGGWRVQRGNSRF